MMLDRERIEGGTIGRGYRSPTYLRVGRAQKDERVESQQQTKAALINSLPMT